jgi:hypothetical protein
MVEPQIVVLVVAGSSPVGHPANNFNLDLGDDCRFVLKSKI